MFNLWSYCSKFAKSHFKFKKIFFFQFRVKRNTRSILVGGEKYSVLKSIFPWSILNLIIRVLQVKNPN